MLECEITSALECHLVVKTKEDDLTVIEMKDGNFVLKTYICILILKTNV